MEAVEKRARAADRWTDALEEVSETLRKDLTEVEDELIQTKNEAGQDPVNFTPRLDNQIAYLYGHVAQNYGRPTGGSFERFRDLDEEAKPILERLAGPPRRRRRRPEPRPSGGWSHWGRTGRPDPLKRAPAWSAGFSRHSASFLSRGGAAARSAGLRPASRGSAKPAPIALLSASRPTRERFLDVTLHYTCTL